MSMSLSVHGHPITMEHDFLSNVPMILSEESLQELLQLLDRCSVCPGNSDEHYVLMAESMKRGELTSRDRKTVIARVDDFFKKTVRVSTCEVLVTSNKCKSCVAYRNTLRSMYYRWSKKNCVSPSHRQSADSRVNVRWLNTPEKAV